MAKPRGSQHKGGRRVTGPTITLHERNERGRFDVVGTPQARPLWRLANLTPAQRAAGVAFGALAEQAHVGRSQRTSLVEDRVDTSSPAWSQHSSVGLLRAAKLVAECNAALSDLGVVLSPSRLRPLANQQRGPHLPITAADLARGVCVDGLSCTAVLFLWGWWIADDGGQQRVQTRHRNAAGRALANSLDVLVPIVGGDDGLRVS